MKKQYVISLITILFSVVVCVVSVSAKSDKKLAPATTSTIVNKNNKLSIGECKEAPQSQVTNNSGVSIYKVKVGMVEFSKNLSSCFDGCSTGFKHVAVGKNQVKIKRTALSPWKTIGTVGPFSKCKYYSVNMVTKGKTICAQLAERKQTDSTYNNDRTKTIIDETCSHFKPIER